MLLLLCFWCCCCSVTTNHLHGERYIKYGCWPSCNWFQNAVSLIIKNRASKPMMQISGYFWVLQVKTALHCTALSIDPWMNTSTNTPCSAVFLQFSFYCIIIIKMLKAYLFMIICFTSTNCFLGREIHSKSKHNLLVRYNISKD